MAARAPLPPEHPRRDGGHTVRRVAGDTPPRSRAAARPPDDGMPTRAAVRGHAYYADQARRALGISVEPRLAEVPFPIIHAALGVAACAVAVALRPGAVGLAGSVVGVTALCFVTGLVLAAYDRFVYPAEHRPAVEAIALPVAALGAFSLILAGTVDIRTRLVAAAVTVAVCGGLPHLGGLRASGREGWGGRFLRDAAAIAVLVPVLLASASGNLPLGLRVAVALVGVGLVTLDGLRTEETRLRHTAALAALTAVVVTGAMVAVDRAVATPGAAAAVTLVIWYGVRGMVASAVIPPRRLSSVAEHLAVVAIALFGLYWVTR
jgi:hypothetical protein